MGRIVGGVLFAVTAGLAWNPAQPARVVEPLGRGVVAIRTSDSSVYVGWRLLGTEASTVTFNLYRTTGDSPPVLCPVCAYAGNFDGKRRTSAALTGSCD